MAATMAPTVVLVLRTSCSNRVRALAMSLPVAVPASACGGAVVGVGAVVTAGRGASARVAVAARSLAISPMRPPPQPAATVPASRMTAAPCVMVRTRRTRPA